jgi:hypothetical protein
MRSLIIEKKRELGTTISKLFVVKVGGASSLTYLYSAFSTGVPIRKAVPRLYEYYILQERRLHRLNHVDH